MQTPQDLFVHEVSDIRNAKQVTIQMVEQGHHGRYATRRYPDRGRRPDRRYLYLLSGSLGETVTDLSHRLLAHHGGLRGLLRLSVAQLELSQRLAAGDTEDLAGDVARLVLGSAEGNEGVILRARRARRRADKS